MESTLWLMAFTILILLMMSAFLSASEMALNALNPLRVKMHVQDKNAKAIKVEKLLDNYNLTITSIVVGNNIVNILLPTFSTLFFTKIIPDPQVALFCSTVIMTIIVIIFGEIIPKIYGNEQQENYIYKIVNILWILIKILSPLTKFFLTISNFIERKFFPEDDLEEGMVEEEILTKIDEGLEEGNLEENERELIRNAIEFNEIRVDEILQPKSKMFMIDVNMNVDEIFAQLNEQRYSRIPVYEEDTDNIIGILNERDFLNAYIDSNLEDIRPLLREAVFIPDMMKISVLLPQLQKDRTHMALVVDEHGTIQGLITVEDMIEEIVGEIWDEHDEIEEMIKSIGNHEYMVNAALSIDDFNDYFCDFAQLTSEEENTIAGYLIEQLQSIPEQGNKIVCEEYQFTIEKMDGNRVDTIRVQIKDGE